jgi:hypothetical protein
MHLERNDETLKLKNVKIIKIHRRMIVERSCHRHLHILLDFHKKKLPKKKILMFSKSDSSCMIFSEEKKEVEFAKDVSGFAGFASFGFNILLVIPGELLVTFPSGISFNL